MGNRRNPIIESDAEEEETFQLGESDDDFDLTAVDELTDEEVAADVDLLEAGKRASVESSRRRGQVSARGHQPHVTSTKAAADARVPQREHAFEWRPANTLDAPPARAGMEQRWIRYLNASGENDPQNWARKMRDGWVPRKLDTVDDQYNPPTTSHGQLGTVIAVGDVILCERDRRIGASRRAYYRAKLARQTAATQRFTKKVERPDHPIHVSEPFERPTIGRGRRVRAQEDGE